MDCREAREQLYPFLDAELAPEAAAAVEKHLAACGGCKAEADDVRALEDRIQEVCRTPAAGGCAPQALRERLSGALDEAIRAEAAGAVTAGRFRRLARAGFAAAAALLVAAFLGTGLTAGPAAVLYADDHAKCEALALGSTHGRPGDAKCLGEALGLARSYGFRGLKVPVLRDAGLELLDFYPCQIGGVGYAHLVYGAPGREAVSVFVGRRFRGAGGLFLPSDAAPEPGRGALEAIKVRTATGEELVIVGREGTTATMASLVRAQVGAR